MVLLFGAAGHITALAADEVFDDFPARRDVQYPDWFTDSFLDLGEDLDEALAQGKKGIIVYFGQKDCAYCEALMEVNFGREKDIVAYTRRHFNVIPIDIWGSREVVKMDGGESRESAYAEEEQTNFTPSMLFYTAGGALALRLRGYYPPYRFRAALEYVVGGFYERESLRDYLARADPPPKFEIGDINEEDFFDGPPHALDRSRFAAKKPLAVFFEQNDCHACDILHSEPLQDDEARRLLQGFQAVQLDMWSDTPVLTPDGRRTTAVEWADSLGIFHAPTVVFFDEAGTEIIRIDAVVQVYRLRGVLDFVLRKGYLDAPTYQRWRENLQNATFREAG